MWLFSTSGAANKDMKGKKNEDSLWKHFFVPNTFQDPSNLISFTTLPPLRPIIQFYPKTELLS